MKIDRGIRSISEIKERIQRYGNEMSSGASCHQEPYKSDFFKVFNLAYRNGYCGKRAAKRFESARNRRKSTHRSTHVIVGEDVAQLLILTDLGKSPSKNMIEILATWWDEWAYAWDKSPSTITLFRSRRDPEIEPAGDLKTNS